MDFLFCGLRKTRFQFVRVVVIRFGERTRLKRTENRRVEPCKVDKSNGIEIQISGALNDAYRISWPWKGRKCEGKDSVMSCRKEYWKEREGDDRWCSQNLTQSILRRVVKHFEIFLQTLTRCWCNFICDISSRLGPIEKFGRLNYYERCQRNFYF